MNRVYIKTYGCQMNERDSEAVGAMLRNRGYSIVDDEYDADVVLLNTCSVRDKAEQKAIGKTGYLAKRKRLEPDFVLGIMGCMAQNRGIELLDRLPDLDLLVGTQKFHAVPDYLDRIVASRNGLGPRPSTLVDVEAEEGSQNTIRDHLRRKRNVSAFVSIMQGCNMRCTFCIVPKTRGPERARPIADIVEEVEELAATGTREVTLLGQIVNSYGRREIPVRNRKSPFVQLLEKIQEVKGIERIRFTSPHPVGFKPDLIEAFRNLSKLCEYVHLPVQSGSNRVLKRMNRPYSVERYLKIVEALRKAAPNMYFSTDIIVGFPGETKADFRATCRLFDEVAFDMAYIFKYSIRSGTPAATMPDQISREVKERRNQRLLAMLEKTSLARNKTLVGSTEEVLVEGKARRGDLYRGRTRGFRSCLFPAHDRLIGQLVKVSISRVTPSTLYGQMVLKGSMATWLNRSAFSTSIEHNPMTLFAATLITALVLLLAGGILLWNGEQVSSIAQRLPRSRRFTVLIFGLGTVWFLWKVSNLGEADFGNYRTVLLTVFAAIGLLSYFFVPDFLAVRGVCIVALLSSGKLLDSAFSLYDTPARLFLVVFAYLMICLSIYLAVVPYRARDFIQWLFRTQGRPRFFGGLVLFYGLILSIAAFSY